MADVALAPNLSGLADPSRTHVTVRVDTARGFDFHGCTSSNPDVCACADPGVWCPRCDHLIRDGQQIVCVTTWTYYDGDPEPEGDGEIRHLRCGGRTDG